MKIYFNGHLGFQNRGCEALVKSCIKLLHAENEDHEFLVPSIDPDHDKCLWPEHKTFNVTFIELKIPLIIRILTRLTRLKVSTKFCIFLACYFLKLSWKRNRADTVLSIGGDMYTFEGQFPLWTFVNDALAAKYGKQLYLLGATVGSFPRYYAKILRDHFGRFDGIYVRDQKSIDNISFIDPSLNVTRSYDSAFCLNKENYDNKQLTSHGAPVVGFNISPLAFKLGAGKRQLRSIISFLLHLQDTGYHICLVPHVFVKGNSDYDFMYEQVYRKLNKNAVTLIDSGLNSQELKSVISSCNYYVGSRMHSTIAAYSTGVPTIALAYSEKGYNLSEELFNNTDFVLNVNTIDENSLRSLFDSLVFKYKQDQGLSFGKIDYIKNTIKINFSHLQKNMRS